MLARLALAFAVLVGVARVEAQPASAIGLPLPSPDQPTGTLIVRVIDGSSASPHAGMVVWLSVDGVVKTAKTDAIGRATFTALQVGATVTAAISVDGGNVRSQAFQVPASGGTRVLLTTVPMSSGPPPRETSGKSIIDETAPPTALSVRLTYNDLADAQPPAKQPVYLASYAADGKVAVVVQRTDAKGVAHFTGLDPSGAVAYYPLATLSRARKTDRLAAMPVMPGGEHGAALTLSAEKRTSTAQPVDELAPAAVASGKLHVSIQGISAPDSPIHVIDAATGKQLAAAKGEKDALIAQPPGDRVLYVEAIVRGEAYRSRPFLPVADRGAEIAIYALPRFLVSFKAAAEPDGVGLSTWMQLALQNNSWIPYATPVAIPLPAGFQHAELDDDERPHAAVSATGLTIGRPLAPGELSVRAHFELPAGRDGKVHWDLDLPNGTYESSFRVAKDPGVAIVEAKLAVAPMTVEGADYLVISPITILPKQRMAMTIELPKLTPAQAAVARACQPLDPDRKSAQRGRPMKDFTAAGLDGAPLKLSSLRGKLILVSFIASWDMLSATELPTLAPLAAKLGKELEIVVVSSDADRNAVAKKVGAKPPFHVVLDPPVTGNIGPITMSWGTNLLPESYLIDKHGVVRMYFSNARDWSTPDARACLEAVAKD